MERKSRNRSKMIMVIVGAVILAGVVSGGVIFAYRAGEAKARERVESSVEALAEAVSGKAEWIEKLEGLEETWRADTETIDKEGIDRYVSELEKLVGESSGEVRTTLTEYLEKWKKLQGVYAGENNEEIMKAFEEVKAGAGDAEVKLQGVLDDEIEKAVKGL